ncbi:hypothetical protein [Mucilaginibacter psychrotolerans]|uniref:General secretion pathway protein GspM n=1 Tax=Mucilaginibacter psychrotolerans TaxID=1524096 RepID=A0A4Y8SBE9_9SPHI|nr:hypothetical protein [Mucilaginibacter psychrotolerans]TFF36212.1 hypothetical protein E2R66_16870 [Mucilaginibacter psychrotolerans]
MMKAFFITNKYGLWILSAALLLISYQLALKKTVEAWQLNNRLKAQSDNAGDLSYQPAYLERKNDNLNKLIKSYSADTADFRSDIIDKVASVAAEEKVKLTSVPLPDVIPQDEHLITQQLVLEGSYTALMRTVQKLYALQGIGLVRSVTLKMPTQRQSSKNKPLVMQVYIAAIRR